jgi:beta-galactosidase
MLFGASYYHEYQPYERLEADLELMVRANVTVIRVGESTWASYEPRPGEISFAALRRVVDAATAAGIKVIVGTPTYAIPPWMARLHPEVMAVTRAGPVPYGARQNVDFTAPAYRFYAERLIRAMGREFGHDEGVIAFQLDNEIGVFELANPHVMARFRAEVVERLGGVEGVNERWGLTYWSHRLSDAEDLWEPAGNTNPGYALEWARFQARLATEFLVWQRDILRQHVDPDKQLLHDTVGGWGGRWSDSRAIGQALDRGATNVYVVMQHGLDLPEAPAAVAHLAPEWQAQPLGAWQAVWKADAGYSQHGPAGSRFYVTEAQATSIGGSSTNVPPFPGQLKLMAHLLAGRGAELLAYWHWHTLHYGFETYWGGVLGHDLEPNRIFAEVAELGAELRRLAPDLEGLVPHADVAMLQSGDSMAALSFMPPLADPLTGRADPASYQRIFSRLYIGALEARLQTRIVHEDSDWSGPSVLVVPALYIASDELLGRLVAHAAAGHHLVVTFRTGYANEWARARAVRAPAALRGPAGCSYQEYTNLAHPVPLRPVDPETAHCGVPQVHPSAHAEAWADGLQAEGATALWRYEDPFLASFPALVTHEVGAGRISWLGTLPDRESCAALLAWALAERGRPAPVERWGALPARVRLSSATAAAGATLWFVANHGWEPAEVTPPARVRDLATDHDLERVLRLGPWESRVLREAPPAARPSEQPPAAHGEQR